MFTGKATNLMLTWGVTCQPYDGQPIAGECGFNGPTCLSVAPPDQPAPRQDLGAVGTPQALQRFPRAT
jgi:hypothetical protein